MRESSVDANGDSESESSTGKDFRLRGFLFGNGLVALYYPEYPEGMT